MRGDYRACKTCGEWGWSDTHTCPPVFECIMEDDGQWESLCRIYAAEASDAAEKFVERNEQNGDGPRIAADEDEVVVLVRPEYGGEVSRWAVRGWMSPCYSAEAAEDPDAEIPAHASAEQR